MKFKYLTEADRYGGKTPPSPICDGQCEGTGFVPINADETDKKFKKLWLDAEIKDKTKDGWHFVKCPDCNGSGALKEALSNYSPKKAVNGKCGNCGSKLTPGMKKVSYCDSCDSEVLKEEVSADDIIMAWAEQIKDEVIRQTDAMIKIRRLGDGHGLTFYVETEETTPARMFRIENWDDRYRARLLEEWGNAAKVRGEEFFELGDPAGMERVEEMAIEYLVKSIKDVEEHGSVQKRNLDNEWA